MVHRVRLRNGGEFRVQQQQTILEAGLDARFGFPHACRNGACLRCAGRLVHGTVRINRGGDLIRAGDAGADSVLYCRALPLSDCEIDVPDITPPGQLPVVEVNARVSRLETLTPEISRAWLQLPAGQNIKRYAGQYLELLLPQGPCAFSMANRPDGGRDIELHVRHGADNPASLTVLDALAEQTTVKVRLPSGERFIDPRQLPEKPVWFICGSTGFAPAKAMIEELIQLDFQQPIRLYWGARDKAGLYLDHLARQWAVAGRIDYFPVVESGDAADCHRGLVHQLALNDLDDPQQPEFHIGGSPPMAWAVFDALRQAGVPAASIHSDVYDYAPREEH